MTVLKDVGKNIRTYRKQMKLTQKELGERTGYAEVSIRQIEAGMFLPGLARLEGVATALGVDISRLFCSEVVPSEYHNGPSMEWVDIKEEKPQECGKKYIVATSAGIVKTMRYKQEALIACGDGFGNKNGGYHKSNVVMWMDMPPIPTRYFNADSLREQVVGKLEYGSALKNKLRRENMTLEELSNLCGHKDYQWAQRYVNGRTVPRVDVMLQIESALGWPVMEQLHIAYPGIEREQAQIDEET